MRRVVVLLSAVVLAAVAGCSSGNEDFDRAIEQVQEEQAQSEAAQALAPPVSETAKRDYLFALEQLGVPTLEPETSNLGVAICESLTRGAQPEAIVQRMIRDGVPDQTARNMGAAAHAFLCPSIS